MKYIAIALMGYGMMACSMLKKNQVEEHETMDVPVYSASGITIYKSDIPAPARVLTLPSGGEMYIETIAGKYRVICSLDTEK